MTWRASSNPPPIAVLILSRHASPYHAYGGRSRPARVSLSGGSLRVGECQPGSSEPPRRARLLLRCGRPILTDLQSEVSHRRLEPLTQRDPWAPAKQFLGGRDQRLAPLV